MRNSVKIVIAVLAVMVVSAALFLCLGNKGPAEETKREPLPLFAALDSADMMIAYAEGLGDARQERTVDGRLYRNFVQLLRTNRMQGNLQDTFTTNCKTGARLALFKDTTLVEEFLFADRIGREGVPGTWTPRRFGKINKFLKDVGVQFKPCVNPDEDENTAAIVESQRPVLTMPKIGSARKKKDSADAAPVDSAEALDVAASPEAANEVTNGEITNNVLNVLDGIILPADTAVGAPLESQFQNWNRAKIVFYKEPYAKGEVEKEFMLGDADFKALGEHLKNSRYETYASAEGIYTLFSKLVLYKDSVAVMELWDTSRKLEWLEKRPLHNGESFERSGYWFAANPAALKTFFDNLKAYRPE